LCCDAALRAALCAADESGACAFPSVGGSPWTFAGAGLKVAATRFNVQAFKTGKLAMERRA
jgi:hypothetical protein